MPKITVIITIYNRERFIVDCARSLLEQTLDDVEYLFVDDASTDNSVSLLQTVLDDFPARRHMAQVLRMKQNGGRAVARQTGVDHATGEYVIHVDSDDWVDADMLELLYLKAKETGADIVGCNITHEYKNCKKVFKQSYYEAMDDNISGLLNGKIFPSLCTSLTRTALIRNNNIRFPQGVDTGEDLLFNLQLYLHANKVIGIENPSYHYRHTEESGSYNLTEKDVKSVIDVAIRIDELMKQTANYEKFKYDILFRKFSMKCALVINFDNKQNNLAWLRLFPETHPYIWSFKQFDWKRRVEYWLAAHRLFGLARLFQRILRFQHKVRGL